MGQVESALPELNQKKILFGVGLVPQRKMNIVYRRRRNGTIEANNKYLSYL